MTLTISERLRGIKKTYYDDLSDYNKGQIKGALIGFAIYWVVDVLLAVKDRR